MLTLWRPHNELFRWSQDLDSFFERGRSNAGPEGLSPEVDIEETEAEFLITADLPGVEEKNIGITVKDGVLTVSGHRETTVEHEATTTVLRERSSGSFQRSFRISRTVNSEKIAASYKNGVLQVVLPKAEETKPRQIQVSTN